MITKIKQTRTGNCRCRNCGKEQPGGNYQPFTLWYKLDNESRGHNEPVCSIKCAEELAAHIKKDHN